MKRALLAPAAFALSALLALPLAAQTLETRAGAGPLKLQKTGSAWQLDSGRGPAPLQVPASTRFSALRAAGSSFAAAGVDQGPKGASLVVVAGSADGKSVEVLPAPAVAAGEIAFLPTPVVGPGGLEALLWIEGKNHQSGALKVALWNAGGFASPGVISPAGPGTQTALQALRLNDGTWLAVWSAFDGQDDEILWSRGSVHGWSPAKSLTGNAVPDVTPTLRLTPGGAVVVWSFYDGNDYRLQSSTLRDWTWTDGEVFGGKGSNNPVFAETEAATLTFRQVVPETWQVVELDEQGKVRRQASLPTATRRPPAIVAVDNNAVTIEWSMSDAGTAPVSIVVPWEGKF
jgi:hypothetical protein